MRATQGVENVGDVGAVADRERWVRRIRAVVAATICWNVIEAMVALGEGARASSVALLGFGLGSVIEVSSAAAVAWQFSARDHDRRQVRERWTLRLVAASFYALAAFVTVDSLTGLVTGREADESPIGLALAAASLIVMPTLSRVQRRAGDALRSRSAVADSRQTMLCAYLSAVLLGGLALNALVGWWWADPLAALGIAGLAVREGNNARRGDLCCAGGNVEFTDGGGVQIMDGGGAGIADGGCAGSGAAGGCCPGDAMAEGDGGRAASGGK